MKRSGLFAASLFCLLGQMAFGGASSTAFAQGNSPAANGVIPDIYSALLPSISTPAGKPSGAAATSASTAAAATDSNGSLGQGDPQDVDDPTASTGVWRTYSAIDPSTYANNLVVSTNIGYSSDNGQTFSLALELNPGSDTSTSGSTWDNETSSLFSDLADPTANSSWKVIWDHHVTANGNVNLNAAWLGMRSTNVPNGTWSSEVKLLAGAPYDPHNSFSPGPTLYPLPSALGDCLYLTEPGTLTATNGFYMSLVCYSIGSNRSVVPRVALLQFTYPAGATKATLSVKGTLLNSSSDVSRFVSLYGKQYPELQTTSGFTEPSLVTTSGKTYLLASPITQNAQFGKHDAGCAVFQVTNLSNAAILRTPNGAPQMIKYVQGPANTPRGACTYTPHDTGSGINFAEISPGSSPPIQIVESLVQLP
jgi:hypothetical protein